MEIKYDGLDFIGNAQLLKETTNNLNVYNYTVNGNYYFYVWNPYENTVTEYVVDYDDYKAIVQDISFSGAITTETERLLKNSLT